MLLKLKWVCVECSSERMSVFICHKLRVQTEECLDCGALVISEGIVDSEPPTPSKSGGE